MQSPLSTTKGHRLRNKKVMEEREEGEVEQGLHLLWREAEAHLSCAKLKR